MMLRQVLALRAVQASLGLVLASATAATVAVVQAVRLDDLPVASRELPLSLATLESGPRTSAALIDVAVAAAPFAPNRRPSAARASSNSAAPVTYGAVELQLVGTVVDSATGSFALVTMPGQPTRIVRVNQEIEGLRLRSVEQGMATFTKVSNGERITLRVPRSR